MAVSTSVTVNGITYSIAADGVATAKTTKPNLNVSNGDVKVYDTKNSRYYTMVKEYKSHPGIANGKTSDEALPGRALRIRAGDQGKIGNGSSSTLCSESYDQIRQGISIYDTRCDL